MPRGRSRPALCLGLLALAAAPAATAMSQLNAADTVLLTCDAQTPETEPHLDGMCTAMASALRARTDAPVTRTPGGETALTLHLRLVSATPTHLVARLNRAGAPGTEMTLGVMDTTLDARFYDHFAQTLLRSANPPLP